MLGGKESNENKPHWLQRVCFPAAGVGGGGTGHTGGVCPIERREKAERYAWEDRDQVHLSGLQQKSSHISDCLWFLKLSRRDCGTSLGYPPYSLAIPTARKFFLISSLQCACGAASRLGYSRGYLLPPPHSMCCPQSGTDPMSRCLLKLQPFWPLYPRVPRAHKWDWCWEQDGGVFTETSGYRSTVSRRFMYVPGRKGHRCDRSRNELIAMYKR